MVGGRRLAEVAISKRDLIFDSLILLPALGFPAIAELNEQKARYEIFVSMLVITTLRDSSDIQKALSSILAIEEFNSHLDGRLPSFSARNNWKITPQDIRILPTLSGKNKVFWLSQPNFIHIKSKFLNASGYGKKKGIKAEHIEFLLTLPFDQSSPDIQGRLFNLVCKHERSKSTFKRILSNIKPKDNVPYKSSIITKIGEKPIIPYHPIYIPPEKDYLNIAHISDTHVSRRWDAMEYWAKKRDEEARKIKGNLFKDLELELSISKSKCFPDKSKTPWSDFNNPNRNFEEALKKANENSEVDIIIITGDLIDYNLGYHGDVENKENYFDHGIESYYYNYNWPLFYEILLKNYKKPVFTILGNHDYRLAPYGVVTKGEMPIGGQNYADDLGIKVKKKDNRNDELNCLKTAMGFIYPKKMIKHVGFCAFGCTPKPEEPHFGIIDDLKTDYKHVEWYNLVINPALDYKFSYKNMHFLFFDWRENEEIFGFREKDFQEMISKSLPYTQVQSLLSFAPLLHGRVHRYHELLALVPLFYSLLPLIFSVLSSLEHFGCPWAEDVLTDGQKDMLRKTIEAMKSNTNKGEKILIVSMHPTVFCEPRTKYTDGIIVDDESREDEEPEHLAWGNFEKDRLWFIEQLWEFVTNQKGKAIVLSGHAHKNRVYTIRGSKVEDRSRECFDLAKESPVFIVTTSSAYISREEATPGFRILKFVNGAIDTELVTINKKYKTLPPNTSVLSHSDNRCGYVTR